MPTFKMPSVWYSASALLLLPACISAVSFDCKHIRAEKKSFDLSALGGPKTVHWQQWQPPSISNTTFTVDICETLKKDKEIPNDEQCITGTKVCAVEEIYTGVDGERKVARVIPIAGDFMTSHGRALNPKVTLLQNSTSNSDSDKEGLLVQFQGGKWPETRQGHPQKAIIEFQCDREWKGTEGFGSDEKKLDDGTSDSPKKREGEGGDQPEDDGPDLPDLDAGKALEFKSFKEEADNIGVLRLIWKTKYACEGAADEPSEDDGKKGGHWGFFTWFLIILFLLAAAYIIFGSWLNYNRYGARGWDLIPHGDTIRDIPYIVKEWAGDMMDRVRGAGSRGGYSAV